jgi:hypothetical protein
VIDLLIDDSTAPENGKEILAGRQHRLDYNGEKKKLLLDTETAEQATPTLALYRRQSIR